MNCGYYCTLLSQFAIDTRKATHGYNIKEENHKVLYFYTCSQNLKNTMGANYIVNTIAQWPQLKQP